MKLWMIAAAAVALTVLNGCTYLSQAELFTEDRIDSYCAVTPPMQRQVLRGQLAYQGTPGVPDGTPRVIVNCPGDPEFFGGPTT